MRKYYKFLLILFVCLSYENIIANTKDSINITMSTDSSINVNIKDTINSTNKISLDTIYFKNFSNNSIDKESSFVKTYLPSIIALIVLLVTNIVVLIKIRLESKETFKREITIATINFDNSRLEEFYDPIYTTLSTNEGMFNSFGPKTFPEDDDLRNEASIIWNNMVKNIIIPNNQSISDIITKKSHLIIKEDKLDDYLDFLKHAKSYEHFIKFPNSIHNGFKYNPDLKKFVEKNREIIITRINKSKENL